MPEWGALRDREGPRAAYRWTWRPERRVLAVARNVTSVTRLLDVLPVAAADPRVDVVFTVDRGSAFDLGLAEFLADIGATVWPWRRAVRSRAFDLAVSASVNAGLRRIRAPLVTLSHGAGYNRLVPSSTGDGFSSAGLSRHELTHRGRVIPAVLGLSHPEQLERLRRSCPAAVERAVVVGDPCFDRIRVSLPRRDAFRRRLGVRDGRRLVVVNSTWGGRGTLAAALELPRRLVAELPADEYRVALILHPNIWYWHDPFQVRAVLADALDSGLRLLPPREGWRAALIAADVVIGDHGSTSFYGAALDRPTLLASPGAAEQIDPGSPTGALLRALPALSPGEDLRAAVERVRAAHTPGRHTAITGRTLGAPGESARLLRREFYRLMRLPEPETEALVRPVPEPEAETGDRPRAFLVDALLRADPGDGPAGTVTLRRFPVSPSAGGRPGAPPGAFLLALAEAGLRHLNGSPVLLRDDPEAETPAARWLDETLADHPGCLLAGAALDTRRLLLRHADGRELSTVAYRGTGGALEPALVIAAVYAWLREGRPPTGLRHGLRVRAGGTEGSVFVTPPRG
ncbi:hypothetical protein [Allonocardiopsis opalescens]|uniref:CDP-glycerol:poly(Glycerophosphate) glycerophosphotransferase n=1 Tax=Allonocardiopsis opalescens TaxID=1144618 RepID=A0A2T0QF90_9ACTN|nr:hypothetical protein [Allonocardiopsis opalescens]PRY02582.1 hypothetical protein CLV72_1011185 [Allonocardiopsis opalescens]